MPGQHVAQEDRGKIDPKFFCSSCKMLLVEPNQTSCGHLMCETCVHDILSNEKPACPVDGTELRKEEIFPDGFTKRAMKSLNLKCPNAECKWRGAYEDLLVHYSMCDHSVIECVHAQCGMEFQRRLLGKHLSHECQYRKVKCEHCGDILAFASIKEHVDTRCEAAPVACKYCKTEVPRKDVEKHEKQSCDEIPAKCEFQEVGCNHQKVLKRKELREHSNNALALHLRLLLQYFLNFVSQLQDYTPRVEFSAMLSTIREEVSEIRTIVTEKFVTIIGKVTGLERRIEAIESKGVAGSNTKVQELETRLTAMDARLSSALERNQALERMVHEKNSAFERMRSRMDQADESLALNTVKIADIESSRRPAQIAHSYNGTLLWRIDGFKRKRQEAINETKTALYSPHFYSTQYGYKMCAKIYMNGDGFGKGSHISLFFVIMKSDHDALLVWPFQKKITMMVLDQGSGDHLIDAFHSDPQSSSFQRPKADMNVATGSPLFMPVDSLNNRAYVKDDVMFIKIIID